MADKVCSFCNAMEGKMIKGVDTGLYICYDCIELADKVCQVQTIMSPEKKVIRPKCFNKEA